jgi:hypothetical protein
MQFIFARLSNRLFQTSVRESAQFLISHAKTITESSIRAVLAILLTWRIGQDDFTEFNQQQTSWVNPLVPADSLK